MIYIIGICHSALMPSLLVLGVTKSFINRFTVGSMIEARNLKEFLDETHDYQWVEIYRVREADGPMMEISKVALVAR
jgi:hypothetical protein